MKSFSQVQKRYVHIKFYKKEGKRYNKRQKVHPL